MEDTGYINGSDLLLKVGGKAVGHCTSHTLTFNSETKDRAVKPVASAAKSSGLWKDKGVTGLSISISAEGLRFYGETENGHEQIAPLWGKGASVEVEAFKRGGDTKPYVRVTLLSPHWRRQARRRTMLLTACLWRTPASLRPTRARMRLRRRQQTPARQWASNAHMEQRPYCF